MSNNTPYRSTIKSRPFFYSETKKLAFLHKEGLNELEIRQQVLDENILQITSLARRKEVAAIITKRIHSLDEFLINKMITGSIETSKVIVLYAIIKTDRLFYEFIHEVITEKIIVNDLRLNEIDLDNYFETKKIQSKTVASWQDYTIYKLKQVYKRILFEAGFLKRNNNFHTITVPIIDPEVTKHLFQMDQTPFLRTILGGKI